MSNDIQREIDKLRKELNEKLDKLEAKVEGEQKGIWKPKVNDEYWYIDDYGFVNKSQWTIHPVDIKYYEFNNIYSAKETAEKQANYLRYTNLLRKYVEEHSEPLDWVNESQDKYYLVYNHIDDEFVIFTHQYLHGQGTIYASSEQVLKDAIEFVGEENIKKYIFGAKD